MSQNYSGFMQSLNTNLDVVFFFYGLAFIILGLTVFLQLRLIKKSEFRLHKILWILGAFGITHGIKEFIDMFTIIKGHAVVSIILDVSFLAVSFFFLLYFGYCLINIHEKRIGKWFIYLLLISVPVYSILAGAVSHDDWLIPVRYFLGFVGGMLSSIGFYSYYKHEYDAINKVNLNNYFIAIAFFFGVYGALAGLVTYKANFFPASIINTEWFISVVGVPVQVFRALMAIGIAWSVWHIVHIFNLEENANRKHAEEKIIKLNEDLKRHAIELTAVNKELEAFSYSVSHDLRAPLRSIDGFSQALLEEYGDKFDEEGKDYIRRVRAASQRMAQLIDDMLKLSRLTRSDLMLEKIDLSAMVKNICDEMQAAQPERHVEFVIAEGVTAKGDARLLRAALENLLQNAWKFTGKKQEARIEFAVSLIDGEKTYFIQDNGAGFDMTYTNKLFGAFQRLHSMQEFPGNGIGLAIVQRIIRRHGGKVWAKGEVDKGAAFYFTLGSAQNNGGI